MYINQNIINIAFLIGRIIAGGFFLASGINHFAKLSMMAGYAKSKARLLRSSPPFFRISGIQTNTWRHSWWFPGLNTCVSTNV